MTTTQQSAPRATTFARIERWWGGRGAVRRATPRGRNRGDDCQLMTLVMRGLAALVTVVTLGAEVDVAAIAVEAVLTATDDVERPPPADLA